MKTGGIVLCGGKSRRMGLPKSSLPVGPESMLQRVVRLVSLAVQPTVVVAAADQQLPELPDEVLIARDLRPECGPLAGLQAGLDVLQHRVDAAYATSCDVPRLEPAFVERMTDLLGQHQIAVPVEGDLHHPLAAVYRTEVLAHITQLLDANRLRPVFLYDVVPTRRVHIDDLRVVDPQLASLINLNRPTDYLATLDELGFSAPADILEQLQGCEGSET